MPLTATTPKAAITDLYGVAEKAEIINGEIVIMPATGGRPGYAGDEIYSSLRSYVRMNRHGRAVGDNKAFAVSLPHRSSFSPDAAYYVGPDPGMKFYQGAPVFAAEVRSENDYGARAEREMAQKRARAEREMAQKRARAEREMAQKRARAEREMAQKRARAEREMAQKRADYFAAGTLIVWDVDLLSADVIRVYHAVSPDQPRIYRRGETAEADPAVPGWQFPVDDLFG